MIQKMFSLIFQYRILFTSQNNDKPLLESKETIQFAFEPKCLGNAFLAKNILILTLCVYKDRKASCCQNSEE